MRQNMKNDMNYHIVLKEYYDLYRSSLKIFLFKYDFVIHLCIMHILNV